MRVKTPEELRQEIGLDDDWIIAGGNSGLGPDTSCVVYCRKPGEDFWGRIYEMAREDGDDVFDTILDLLRWYAHFREQYLANISELSEKDVFRSVL